MLRRIHRWSLCCVLLIAPPAEAQATGTRAIAQHALDSATHGTGAVAVVLDMATGRTLATERAAEVERLRSTPGSILKPFFLTTALRDGTVGPRTAVFCRRTLHVAGHALECTHPQSDVLFDAEEALAYSCNTWFAELAKRLSPEEIARTLQAYGFGVAAGRPAGVNPIEARELLVLGVAGIAVSPRQLAGAYRRLALEWQGKERDAPEGLVHQAMRDSVAYGMAHNAAVRGLDLAGKTGTATGPSQPWSHGWFCGEASSVILVVYVPHGNGADAASVARAFFAAQGSAGR